MKSCRKALLADPSFAERVWRTWLALALALVFGTAPAFAQKELMSRARERGAVRVVVGVRSSLESADATIVAQDGRSRLRAKMRPYGVTNVREFRFIPFLSMEVNPTALAALMSDPDVTSIEEDIPVPPLEISTPEEAAFDPAGSDIGAPALVNSTAFIGANDAWSSGYTGLGQVSVILDTGVDKNHPFLSGKVISEACYSKNTSSSSSLCPGGATSSTSPGSGLHCDLSVDGCDHGTHVAGITAGKGASFSGVAKDAKLISIQVFSRFNSRDYCGSSPPCALSWKSDQIAALERVYELRHSYSIASVNMSLGGGVYYNSQQCDTANPVIKAAIDNLRSVGIATVIAAGNNGYVEALSAPGCISSAISVGSTNNSDSISYFSNEAPFLSLYAPGELIYSSVPLGGMRTKSGTSMATPHVTGAWAVLKQKAPYADVDRVLSALRNTGVPLTSALGSWSTARIRVDSALGALIAPIGWIDAPTANASLAVPFRVAGWAIDATATTGTGVDVVQIWADPTGGDSPILLGAASLAASRPDIGNIYGPQHTPSGYSLTVNTLSNGTYTIRVLARLTATGEFVLISEVPVRVSSTTSPLMAVDAPIPGATVHLPFSIDGWAVDRAAASGPGVDTIHVWALPQSGASAIFLGDTVPAMVRPDVAAALGAQFTPSGYSLTVNKPIADGNYTLVVYAHSVVSGTFNNAKAIPVTVKSRETMPVMFVDFPGEGANLSVPFRVAGWAIDYAATSGPGVDEVHIWALPHDGGSAVFLGAVKTGVHRPDIGVAYGAQFAPSGFNLEMTSGLAVGGYTLIVYAHSSVTRTFNNAQVRSITVQP